MPPGAGRREERELTAWAASWMSSGRKPEIMILLTAELLKSYHHLRIAGKESVERVVRF